MQSNYENLIKDKFGEISTIQDDVTFDGEVTTELATLKISTTDDVKLFYKANSGS